MINLLPPSQKEEISLMETFRLVLILGILFSSFLISFSLILLLVKINLEKELMLTKISLEEKEKEAVTAKAIRKLIEDFNLELSKLHAFEKKKINTVEILEKISQNLPEKVYLTNFKIAWTEKEGLWQVSLSGFSPDRESLLKLKENLGKEKNFLEIYFPPENWVASKNINFHLTFKIK